MTEKEPRMQITVRDVDANGWRFRCREAGGAGEPVLLLHGFPETSRMWEPLMARLAGDGYHCVAPDQRGYSPGARPQEAGAYRYEDIAADALGLAQALGFERFHLIGHDWGAIAGWAALTLRPGPVASWTALSVPHYLAFARAVRDDPDEGAYRSILGRLLAEDGSTEAALAADDFAGLRAAWVHSTPAEVEDYLAVFGQPGASRGALSWYRACRGHARALDDDSFVFGPVAAPTLLIWGRDDPYVRRMSVDLAAGYMTGPYRTVELDAGHFLVQEAPQAVADEICAHIRQHPL
jgi:pimeloyl-ACP methyl ester carboxylesterase